MNRLNFKDWRGDEYTFLQHNTGEIKVTKKSRLKEGSHVIDFSSEAIEKFQEFLALEVT